MARSVVLLMIPVELYSCTDNFDESCRPQIAFDSGSEPQLACPARPATQWGLPMPEVSLPPSCRLCLKPQRWKVRLPTVEDRAGAKPGFIAGLAGIYEFRQSSY